MVCRAFEPPARLEMLQTAIKCRHQDRIEHHFREEELRSANETDDGHDESRQRAEFIQRRKSHISSVSNALINRQVTIGKENVELPR